MIKVIVFEIETVFYDGNVLYDSIGRPHENVPYMHVKMVEQLRQEGYTVVGIAEKKPDLYINNIFDLIYVKKYFQGDVIEKIQKDFSVEIDGLCYVYAGEHPMHIDEKRQLPNEIGNINPTGESFWVNLRSYLGVQTSTVPWRDGSKIYQTAKKIFKSIMPSILEGKVTGRIRNLRSRRKSYYQVRKKRKTSFGEKNPGITFYLVRTFHQALGPFSCWFHYLDQIEYAVSKGYHPVIDLKKYYMRMWQDLEEKGKVNAWETYFEQPLNDSLEEVYQSKNVILGWGVGCSPTAPDWNKPILEGEYQFDKYFPIVKKYLRFNKTMQEYIQKIHDEIFPKKGKVLGVGYRRGYIFSYLNNNSVINDHPRQQDIDSLIYDIKKYMREWKCDHVFFSVDDRECVDLLKDEFSDKLIVMERIRGHYFKNDKPVDSATEIRLEYLTHESDSIYTSNRDYFAEVALLSMCHCLYSGISSATQAAILYNNRQYEHIHLYKEGRYIL